MTSGPDHVRIPLAFPEIPVGPRQTPLTLEPLLYRGGANLRRDQVEAAIQSGHLGQILFERVEVVQAIHACIAGKLAGGGSAVTASNQIKEATVFFGWAESAKAPLTKSQVEATYLAWSEHLYHRAWVIKNLSKNTAYSGALRVSQVLDSVLERQKPLIRLTRLTRPSTRKTPQGVRAEKQSLHETFQFGHLLQDICDGLPLEVVWGPYGIQIPLRAGGSLAPWTGGSTPRAQRERAGWELRAAAKRKQVYEHGRSLEHRGRKAIVNLRVLAELLMFIGQTGMNVSDAHGLKLRHFSYTSHVDGYSVREYKQRRGGEVLFQIYAEYRSHFERYLRWRSNVFPDSLDLFPYIREDSHESRAPRFELLIAACKQTGVKWIPPSTLRGTRVNWLLRRSGDPDLSAEMAQHHKQALLDVYERPSLHRAIGEVARFWMRNDPALASSEPSRAVAPGECDGNPAPSLARPPDAPLPDCTGPSGCLWCDHHRDVDSLDHVWSLACFRHLKILELGKHVFAEGADKHAHPAKHAIDKLSEKLAWFRSSHRRREGWVEEALARIEESNYHEDWALLIAGMEGTVA